MTSGLPIFLGICIYWLQECSLQCANQLDIHIFFVMSSKASRKTQQITASTFLVVLYSCCWHAHCMPMALYLKSIAPATYGGMGGGCGGEGTGRSPVNMVYSTDSTTWKKCPLAEAGFFIACTLCPMTSNALMIFSRVGSPWNLGYCLVIVA